ncbi:hypothetical protein BMS3Bbin07_00719 [bacterium BMS3Bbin07]|nr:hypothetical protein BMS3Bbin07_00719 [bacterium BMS3Bbin07]
MPVCSVTSLITDSIFSISLDLLPSLSIASVRELTELSIFSIPSIASTTDNMPFSAIIFVVRLLSSADSLMVFSTSFTEALISSIELEAWCTAEVALSAIDATSCADCVRPATAEYELLIFLLRLPILDAISSDEALISRSADTLSFDNERSFSVLAIVCSWDPEAFLTALDISSRNLCLLLIPFITFLKVRFNWLIAAETLPVMLFSFLTVISSRSMRKSNPFAMIPISLSSAISIFCVRSPSVTFSMFALKLSICVPICL